MFLFSFLSFSTTTFRRLICCLSILSPCCLTAKIVGLEKIIKTPTNSSTHFPVTQPCLQFCNSRDSSVFMWLYTLHAGKNKTTRANNGVSYSNLKIPVEMLLGYLVF